MIESDILIIGAGPTGLFTVFEAGLLKLKCHLVDALPQVGGQLSEIYPKKPIYDIPGYPSVLAGDLIHNLMEQIKPFHPTFTLGERAETLEKREDGKFVLTTHRGTKMVAPVIAIAGGLGSFEPRKPPIENIAEFEERGVEYMVRHPEDFIDREVVIAGGGDSALDWTVHLAELGAKVTMVHRRKDFRGALDSAEKVMVLHESGKINLITEAQVLGLQGNGRLNAVKIVYNEGREEWYNTEYFLPLFGLTPKLGPIEDWGLEIERQAIKVDTYDYSTNIPGIFAIGDVNTYPNKLKLILCGFHEATLMCQSAFKIVHPDKKLSFKYTTVTGIEGI